MKANKDQSVKYIEYVITVHGIGNQRHNETVSPVINRFAEVRQGQRSPQNREVVSLGMISSQTGKPQRMPDGSITFEGRQPWCEFANIPADGNHEVEFFLGEPSYDGENVRFIDLCWADIMEKEFPEVGQSTEEWAKKLLDRLEMKQIRDKKEGKNGEEHHDEESRWILPTLYQVEETIVFLKTFLSLRAKNLSEMIFDRFLGDVQLYGEYLPIRGKAVRRFHRLMNKIEKYHIELHCPDHSAATPYKSGNMYVKPRYTIIAHSLGTVMSMDTLMYAHLHKNIHRKELLGKFDNLPFPNYATQYDSEVEARNEDNSWKSDSFEWILEQKGESIGEGWIDNIHSYVTLGSPIDKFLVIWWQNYQYLKYDHLFKDRLDKIKHYNYCDEQDPVGHFLDLFEKQPVYSKLFEKQEDIVYNRYAVPGKAHVDYWTDYELFYRIVKTTIDDQPLEQVKKNEIFNNFENKEGVYGKVMFYIYGTLPILMTVICSFFIIWGWEAKGSTGSTLAMLGFVASNFFFRRLIKLSIWWRQILKNKNTATDTKEYVLANYSRQFRVFCNGVLIGLLLLTFIFIPSYFRILIDSDEFDWEHHLYDFGILVVLGWLASFLYHKVLYKPRQHAKFRFGLTVDNTTITSIFAVCAVIAGLTFFDLTLLKGLFQQIDPFAPALKEFHEMQLNPQQALDEQLREYQQEVTGDEAAGYGIYNVTSLLLFMATSVWIFTLNCMNNASREVKKLLQK